MTKTLNAFYDETNTWMEEVKAVDIVFLDFCNVFDTISHNIFKDKLRKCGLDEWAVRYIERSWHRV